MRSVTEIQPVLWQKAKYGQPVHHKECDDAQDVKTEVSYQIPRRRLATENLGIFLP